MKSLLRDVAVAEAMAEDAMNADYTVKIDGTEGRHRAPPSAPEPFLTARQKRRRDRKRK